MKMIPANPASSKTAPSERGGLGALGAGKADVTEWLSC